MTGDTPFAEIEHGEPTTGRNAQTADGDDGAREVAEVPNPPAQLGYIGFTLRELIITGVWVLAFALSFVPGAGSILDIAATVWTMHGAWVLTIGVPTAVTFLLVLRRLSPDGIRRVGSLGIDQFASVAFSVGAVAWAVLVWQQMVLAAATRQSILATWPAWVELVLMAALVALTVFAGLLPGIRDDFEERIETLAHRNANPVRAVLSVPRPVRARGSVSDPDSPDDVDPGLEHENEVAAATHVSAQGEGAPAVAATGYVPDQHRESFRTAAGEEPDATGAQARPSTTAEAPAADHSDLEGSAGSATATDTAGTDPSGTGQAPSDTMTQVLGDLLEPSSADDAATHAVDVVTAPSARGAASKGTSAEAPQPFWALAPEGRVVHDAQGDEIFRIGPDAWILVLEDRGGAFVVRHDDGRVGYLHDTENMTRG